MGRSLVANPVVQASEISGLEPTSRVRGWLRTGGYRLAAGAVIVFGLLAVVLNLGHDLGTLQNPGPGFWPLTCAILLIIFGVAVYRSDTASDHETWDRGSVRVMFAVVSLAAFIVLFGLVGFILSAVVFIFCWLKFLVHEPWRTAISISLAAPLAFYLLFVTILGVAFPFDPVGQFLPRGIL